jgi:adenylate cyclase
LCTLGHESRIDVTAIADTVNVASRIEHLTRELACDILVSETVVEALRGDRALTERFVEQGAFHLRGRQSATNLYGLSKPGPVGDGPPH